MFKVNFLLDKVGQFPTFEEAYRFLHPKIVAEFKAGTPSGVIIATTWITENDYFIEGPNDNNWDNMNERARAEGIIDGKGKLIPKTNITHKPVAGQSQSCGLA